MDTLMGVLFFISLLAFIVFFILLIVKLVFKKGMAKKKILLVIGSSLALMFLSLVLAPELTPEQKERLEEKKELREAEKQEKEEQKALAKEKKEQEEEAEKLKKQEEKEKIKDEMEDKKEKEDKEKAEKKKKKEAKAKKVAAQQKADKEKKETEKKEAESKKKKKEEEKAEADAKQKKEDEKAAAKKKKKANNEPIDKKLEENSDVEKAALSDGVLRLEFDGDGSWSVNTLVTGNAITALEYMKKAFDDKNVSSVTAVVMGTLTDAKGNERKDEIVSIDYSRDTFEELNYKNFHGMALGEEWRIYNESDTYQIHIGVYNDLKDKIKGNLGYGPYKSN